MKNYILISLLFVGLGLRAAHFTDGISEKAKTEYNVLKSIESFECTLVVDSIASNYFTQVDQVHFEKVVIFQPNSKPIGIVNLQSWRNLQSHRQSKKEDGRLNMTNVHRILRAIRPYGLNKINLIAQIKAPPLIS